jgi:hypothetical protein
MLDPKAEHLYELNFLLLLEIRQLSLEKNCEEIFRLTNFLHNLPTRLIQIATGETSPERVLQELQERAAIFGMEPWLAKHQRNLSIDN